MMEKMEFKDDENMYLRRKVNEIIEWINRLQKKGVCSKCGEKHMFIPQED